MWGRRPTPELNVGALCCVSGAPSDHTEFSESNHTAFMCFDIFCRPEKRQSQRQFGMELGEKRQSDLAHQLLHTTAPLYDTHS